MLTVTGSSRVYFVVFSVPNKNIDPYGEVSVSTTPLSMRSPGAQARNTRGWPFLATTGSASVAITPAEALAVAKKAHDKVADEKATIEDILHGRYSSAWVSVALKQKGV